MLERWDGYGGSVGDLEVVVVGTIIMEGVSEEEEAVVLPVDSGEYGLWWWMWCL